MGLSLHYEENLVALIKQLRVQYNAPKAKVSALPSIYFRPLLSLLLCLELTAQKNAAQFVTASLGQSVPTDTTSGAGLILEAMEAVSNGTKYPVFIHLNVCCFLGAEF